ncbi:GNAT family N-acetyltransferase [Paenibacillus lutrae]|uniref:GNAT family N-acetyltransferase n=1 Tax=Paenibacillus lutrae TaxID=2078573 RepID=A0A7X3FKB2_9BACL|nr:GNAT family N-acetyltransferase [Paenibacillus lutrae]MVP01321.1 GNAT family N-acetyltransferase [Paenibacillus lutrae]
MKEMVQEGNGFAMKIDGHVVAEITFVPQGEALVITHTFVSEVLRGRKIGEELVSRVVSHARENNKKIVPACSFAHALFRRKKEYQDLWVREEE